jgi:hypothetical protein
LGQRSRRRERAAEQPARPGRPSRPSRSEQRNAQARARLEPLGPGERPGAVTVAAALAVVLAIGNIVFLIAGVKVGGKQPGAGGVVAFSLLMVAAAVGLWQARYWAVLGFEALLGVSILVAALSLTVASNWQAVVLCLGTIAICGPLFYKLVRAMARIQMPQRRPPPAG